MHACCSLLLVAVADARGLIHESRGTQKIQTPQRFYRFPLRFQKHARCQFSRSNSRLAHNLKSHPPRPRSTLVRLLFLALPTLSTQLHSTHLYGIALAPLKTSLTMSTLADPQNPQKLNFPGPIGTKRRRMRSGGGVSTATNNAPKQFDEVENISEQKTTQTSKCKGATTIPIFLKSKLLFVAPPRFTGSSIL